MGNAGIRNGPHGQNGTYEKEVRMTKTFGTLKKRWLIVRMNIAMDPAGFFAFYAGTSYFFQVDGVSNGR